MRHGIQGRVHCFLAAGVAVAGRTYVHLADQSPAALQLARLALGHAISAVRVCGLQASPEWGGDDAVVVERSIYIAGFFDTRARIRPYAEALQERGYRVLSSWIWVPAEFSMERPEIAWNMIAERDLAQVEAADRFILDTIDVTPRGGREVELGYALALHKHMTIIGPRRNVFHHIAAAYFDTWEQFFLGGLS